MIVIILTYMNYNIMISFIYFYNLILYIINIIKYYIENIYIYIIDSFMNNVITENIY